MTILDTIIQAKKKELGKLHSQSAGIRNAGPSLLKALRSASPSLIAEIKPKSPSAGELVSDAAIPTIVELYNAHAQGISVLCDTNFFGGGYPLLARVRALTNLPILAKEFIIDTRQIDMATAYGANAVLLIAAVLEPEKLHSLLIYALKLQLDVIIEVHDENDVDRALDAYDSLSVKEKEHVAIGINNRNLRDMSIDLYTTIMLSRTIRDRYRSDSPPLLISESGINQRPDIEQLIPYVQSFLIGTAFLRSDDPEARMHHLFPSL